MGRRDSFVGVVEVSRCVKTKWEGCGGRCRIEEREGVECHGLSSNLEHRVSESTSEDEVGQMGNEEWKFGMNAWKCSRGGVGWENAL